MYTHTYKHTYTYVHCRHIRMYTHAYVHTCIRTPHTHVHMYVHTYIRMYIRIVWYTKWWLNLYEWWSVYSRYCSNRKLNSGQIRTYLCTQRKFVQRIIWTATIRCTRAQTIAIKVAKLCICTYMYIHKYVRMFIYVCTYKSIYTWICTYGGLIGIWTYKQKKLNINILHVRM